MKLHDRKSPRAQWHDYNGAEYFVTICTKNRLHYFGEVVDGTMQLTDVGKYASQCIMKISEIHPDAEMPLFVIMPNHIHMVIILDGGAGMSSPVGPPPNVGAPPNVGLPYYDSSTMVQINGNVGMERPVGLPHCDSSTNDKPTNDNPTSNGKDPEMQRRANRCGRLSHIIGQFKSAVTRFARENQIPFSWQPRYYDRIVRNRGEMNRIALYIEQNPMKWETDCFYDCE